MAMELILKATADGEDKNCIAASIEANGTDTMMTTARVVATAIVTCMTYVRQVDSESNSNGAFVKLVETLVEQANLVDHDSQGTAQYFRPLNDN